MAFEGLTEKLSSAFKKLRNKGRLTESDVKEAMREIRLALLEADVSYKVVKDFIKAVTEKAVGTEVLESLTPAQAIVKIVNQELVSLMGGGSAKITIASQPPTVVMMVGLQGAGKTTNAAKLAGLMRKQNGKRPLLAACDIYRPAAIQQLEVVGKQLDIPVFQMGQENPVTIAEAAIAHAKKHGNDMVFLDTAGRLHVDEALMEELQAIKQAVQPSEILLVVDAMIGQDAVNAAKAFDDALDIDGVVLTKLDGDARGGAALSIKAVTGKPIKFVGMGEKLDNIEVFHPDRMASRILGMGDVLTLIEKAEQQFDMQKAQELAEKLKKNRFTLQDYYDQLVQVKGMGSMDELLGMMPGLNAKALEGATINEKALSRTEAIILSMTPQERENPAILNSSRKKRIAAGCGLQVVDVNRLLKEFGMMQQMTKQMTKLSGKRRK
ncbi:signal recognition particle protein, partial [Evtepia gabavorous]